jgi:hypothetical protein
VQGKCSAREAVVDRSAFLVIIPSKGASSVCDEAADAVDAAEEALDEALEAYKSQTKCKSLTYWHSAQGQKVCRVVPVRSCTFRTYKLTVAVLLRLQEIYHIQAPASGFSAPANWTKTSGTKVSSIRPRSIRHAC